MEHKRMLLLSRLCLERKMRFMKKNGISSGFKIHRWALRLKLRKNPYN
jgi:hypothetical protein